MLQSADTRAAARWLAIRIAALPLIFLVVSFVSYFLLLGPLGDADPARRITGRGATEAQVERVREELDLDEPWPKGYVLWLADAARGDLGHDFYANRQIRQQLFDRLTPTVQVLAMSFVIACIIAAALLYVADRAVWPERAAITIGAALAAFPAFVLSVLASVYPLLWWDISPPVGGYVSFIDDPVGNLRITIPSSVVIGLSTAPIIFWSLGSWRVRPATHVVLIALASWFPIGASMVVVTERIFSVRGLGEWLLVAALVQDLPVLQVLLTLVAFAGMSIRLFRPSDHAPSRSTAQDFGRSYRDPSLVAGALFIAVLVLVSLLAPLSSHDPRLPNFDAPYVGPSWDHWFGTDGLGRDMFTRSLYGVRGALWFAFRVVVLAAVAAALVTVPLSAAQRAAREALRFSAALLLGVAPLWWLPAFLGVFEFDENYLLGAMAAGVACYAVTTLLRDVQPSERNRLADRLKLLIPPTLLATVSATPIVLLLYVTLDATTYVVTGAPGGAYLGVDFFEGYAAIFGAPHAVWFPIITIAALLFPFGLLTGTLARGAISGRARRGFP